MAFTRGQIIAEGLQQAGRSDLTSEARFWLNVFLESQYKNQDYAWLVKSATVSVEDGAALPSDYRAARAASLGTSRAPLHIIDDQEYDAKKTSTNTGTPCLVYLDQLNKLAYFLPPPTSGLTMNLMYYHLPTLPDHTDAATDLQTPVWGLSTDILIQLIFVKALEYNDDARLDKERDMLLNLLSMSKMNNRDLRAGSPKFKMGKSFRKRF